MSSWQLHAEIWISEDIVLSHSCLRDCVGCRKLTHPRSPLSRGHSHPMTNQCWNSKAWPSQLDSEQLWRPVLSSELLLNWWSLLAPHCSWTFPLCPLLLLSPTFFRHWSHKHSPVNILQTKFHLRVSEFLPVNPTCKTLLHLILVSVIPLGSLFPDALMSLPPVFPRTNLTTCFLLSGFPRPATLARRS